MRFKSLSVVLLLAASLLVQPIRAQDIERKDTDKLRYIYLTFDDGPLAGSQHIDSIVLAEQIKISVFLVGEMAEPGTRLHNYMEQYKQNPYVEVYNHSYTHANDDYIAYYNNPQGVLADIQKNEQELSLQNKIVRLPGRNIWRIGERAKNDVIKSGTKAANLLKESGYMVVGWDVEWEHSAKDGSPIQTADEMVEKIAAALSSKNTFTPEHVVVLMHDEMFRKTWEEGELKQLVDKLKELGTYQFEHMSSYPSTAIP